MALIEIPFGGQPFQFEVADENLIEVLSPARSLPLIRLGKEIDKALDEPIGQQPLQEWVKPTDKVILISDDNTRLTPVDRIIPPMLDRLNAAGVVDENISCIMALGTHRYMSREELIAKVGPGVFERIRVFNHQWRDPEALVDLGVSKHGTSLLINRAVVEADVVIGLGAIVPHHIPGFSGSSKIIQPGVSGARTTAQTHILSCESGGDSFLGIHDNPVRSDMDDIADRVGMSTIFNVVLDSEGRVCGLFFGEMRAAYRRGVALARRIYGVDYSETPDIVLVNSHPCNLDFWQSHKSLYPAQRMIKKGGTIICCTPAPEGVSPVHTELLDFTAWPSKKIKAAYQAGELKNGVACALAIAWAMVREKAEIITVSDGISREDKEALGHIHAPDISSALEIAFGHQGPAARLTVLTHAPDMLPIHTPEKQ
jgi:nickel-dependent lactate racemase